MMQKHGWVVLSVFLGGSLGTLLRYLINMQTTTLLFPVGTIIENIIGSLLLGTLTGWTLVKVIVPVLKEGIGVGFCGGFTTMSTLAADAVLLGGTDSMGSLATYLLISLFGGMFVAAIGLMIGQYLANRSVKKESREWS
ncbi:fluoride efflux transporter FluC [Salipaludibacillus sp. CF4.18]|uniref:fluoride efflux transporter FluC n=1 Tax=Salipaludibacillus sp. CF4.18 TaxID=3373081 RepID=UPI003EE68EA9